MPEKNLDYYRNKFKERGYKMSVMENKYNGVYWDFENKDMPHYTDFEIYKDGSVRLYEELYSYTTIMLIAEFAEWYKENHDK